MELPKIFDDYPAAKEYFTKKDKYILDENNNVIPASLIEWGKFMESIGKKRIIRKDVLMGVLVSTVFLGTDHKFSTEEEKQRPDYKPDIFETMIFDKMGKGNDIYCDRYSTWKEAEEGHKKAIQWVLDGCKENDDDNE